MKKILSVILCALLVLTVIPTTKVMADDTPVDYGYEYQELQTDEYADYVDWYTGMVGTSLYFWNQSVEDSLKLADKIDKEGITNNNYKALIKMSGRAAYVMEDVNATFKEVITQEYFNSGDTIEYNDKIISLAKEYANTMDSLQNAIIDKKKNLVWEYIFQIRWISKDIKETIKEFEYIREILEVTKDADYSIIEQ